MRFCEAFDAVAELGHPGSLDSIRQAVDPAWIEEALQATGTATLRKRRLPAEQVIWLVLGMALYRDRPIAEVCAKLDLALPVRRGPTVAPSALPQARSRVGPEPLAYLFSRTALDWAKASADAHCWRGLALYGIDGTTTRVPDTPENRTHFGGQKAGGGRGERNRGESGYPLVRVVALMALRSHLLEAARLGPYTTGEHAYARDLLAAVPDRSLTILDQNYVAAEVLIGLHQGGAERHWLVRAKTTTRWTVLAELGPDDALVELAVSREARRRNPALPKTYRARAIGYRREGHAPRVLLTSLLDRERYPAQEIVSLYHERWEIELGYDEFKTELLEREEALRSKSVAGIEQELWGLLLVYNLVRLEMERVATEAEVEPVRVSFVAALRLIRDEWLWDALASPGAIPRHLRRLRQDLKSFLLPERRSHRSYPRAVKVKMSNYPRKRPQPPQAERLN